MKELDCVLGPCLDTFIRNPLGSASIALFGTIAVVSLYLMIKGQSMRSRLTWSYPLAFSLLFLLTFFAFSMMCHESVPICSEHALMYSIPAAILGSLLFGYILMPNIYLAWNRAAPSDLGRLLPGPVPVYIADKGEPFAFSHGGISRWIVVSQGMIDILSRKELEAVLLHEYGHLSGNSSFYRISGYLYSKVPLLHAFFDGRALEDEEERKADAFAASRMGTSRYVNSAKRKLEHYFSI